MTINRKYKIIATTIAGALSLYALVGFYVLPALLLHKLPTLLTETTGQYCRLAAVEFNPFSLQLDLHGFDFGGKPTEPASDTAAPSAANQANTTQPTAPTTEKSRAEQLLGFESLHIDVNALASLKTLGLVIDDVALTRPQLHVQRLADGRFNFSSLLPAKKTETPAQPASPPPTLMLRQLNLGDGQLEWQDSLHGATRSESLSAINFSLHEISTTSNTPATLELNLAFGGGGKLQWQGDLNLQQPVTSKGQLNIDTVSLPKVWQLFLQEGLPLEISQGSLGLHIEYQAKVADSGTDLQITNSKVEINQLAIADKTSHAELLSIPATRIDGISVDLGKHQLSVAELTSSDARIAAILQADGRLNYQALFPQPATAPASTTTPAPAPTATGPDWHINVGEVAIKNYALAFSDQSRKSPQSQQLTAINLAMHHYSNQPGNKSPIEFSTQLNTSGKLLIKGNVNLAPLVTTLDITLSTLKLKDFQDYFNDYLTLNVLDGAVNAQGHLQMQSAEDLQLTFQGDVNVNNLLTRDKASNKDFLKWADLQLQQVDVDLKNQNFSLAKILFDRPYLRLTIQKNRSTNINDILVKPAAKSNKPASPATTQAMAQKPATANNISIGKIEFKDGHSDFADYSLILPFVADMDDLHGEINGFSNTQDKPLNLALQGKVYNIAQVVIKGLYQISSGNSDIDLKFSHMPLPLITPYMADFAGYKIEKGQMSLDLQYKIDKGELSAQNKIFIDQLTLGDKVENPHASSLPLHLAIALLKDADGRINMDFPITGSLNDPKFSLGSLISDVLGNFINKLVASPFKALGGLFAGNEDEHSTIGFQPGRADFKPGETDRLDQLSKALQSKPELTLDIKGVAYQNLDWPQMRFEAMTEILKKMKSGELRDKGEQLRSEYVQLSDDEYKRLLTKFFQELFPKEIEFGLLGKPRLKTQPDADFYDIARQRLEGIHGTGAATT
jgi:hypothetical protein